MHLNNSRAGRRAWPFAFVVTGLLVGLGLAALLSVRAAPSDAPGSFLPAVMHVPAPEPVTSMALQTYVTGFTPGTTITDIANAGDDRLFVVEREGRIRVVTGGATLLAEPFLDISQTAPDPIHRVVSSNYLEEGLVGLVFHPDYATNGTFFISYTPVSAFAGDFTFVVERVQVSAGNPNKADVNSRVQLLKVVKDDEVHHGGDMAFGPDGYLYIAIGDGAIDPLHMTSPEPGDLNNHSQNMGLLLGKMLRIDVDMSPGADSAECDGLHGTQYAIPPGNPFADGPGGACDEIYALGLRNPWRFGFDYATGDIYIGDVGEARYEEVDLIPAGSGGGQNFGWHCYEGTLDYSTLWPGDEWAGVFDHCAAPSAYVMPILQYPNSGVLECSITGGLVYRGSQYPGLRGQFLYADWCSQKLWRTERSGSSFSSVQLSSSIGLRITTFGEDADGELYVGGFDKNTIYKLVVP